MKRIFPDAHGFSLELVLSYVCMAWVQSRLRCRSTIVFVTFYGSRQWANKKGATNLARSDRG